MRPEKTFFGRVLLVTGLVLILLGQSPSSQAAPTLDFATYLGGGETIPDYPASIGSPDKGHAVAVDAEGNVYVAGGTYSFDFPRTHIFMSDAFTDLSGFVTKFSPTGERLFSARFDDSQIYDLALDGAGNIYITGATWSEILPLINEYQGYIAESTHPASNAFFMKLAPDLSVLYSTYIGGTSQDAGFGVAADDAGHAYVTGGTFSSDFPTKGEFMTDTDGDREDIWVAKFDTTQAGDASLVYSTYLDGNGDGQGYKIAADSAGNAYVVGTTKADDFPLRNEFMASPGGCFNVVMAKLNSGGDDLLYATYLGRTFSLDYSNRCDIAATDDGHVYVTGTTSWHDFPTRHAYKDTPQGDDVFLTRLNTNEAGDASLVYSTYFGGTFIEEGLSIAANTADRVYLTGRTNSPDFPLREFRPPSVSGDFDIFLAQFDTTLRGDASLLWSTYSGGTAEDGGRAVAIGDPTGGLAITGATLSPDLLVTPEAFQATHANTDFYDAFVIKFSESADIALPIPEFPFPTYYPPPSYCVVRLRPEECRPLAAVQITKNTLDAKVGLPRFQGSADLYLALYFSDEPIQPGTGNNNQTPPFNGDMYFLNSQGQLEQNMTPWMAGVTEPVSQLLSVDVGSLEFEKTYLNLAVIAQVPFGQMDQTVTEINQFNNYYAWVTQIPVPQKQYENLIQELLAKNLGAKKAVSHLQASLNPELWLDPFTPSSLGLEVFEAHQHAVHELMKANSTQQEVTPAVKLILQNDRTLAANALVDAIAQRGHPQLTRQARKHMVKAARELAAGDFAKAVNFYGKAWNQAEQALEMTEAQGVLK